MKSEAYYKRRIAKILSDNSAIREELNEYKRENKSLKKRIETLEKAEGKLKESIDKFKKLHDEMTSELESSREILRDSLKGKARAERQLSIAINQINQMNERLMNIEHFHPTDGDR